MRRAALEPADYPFFDYRRFTFSLGIVARDTAWLSGSTASRFDLPRLEAALRDIFAGGAPVVSTRKTADVRREVFSAPYPAATGVVCDRLVEPGAQLAVEVTAVVDAA